MRIFDQLPVGDSTSWLDDCVTLPDGRVAAPSSGWALRYVLRGPVALDIDAVAQPPGWSTTLTKTASSALVAGLYAWAAQVSTSTERITVGSGQLRMLPDLTGISGSYDTRSQAQKALADCETALASFNASGGRVKRYDIAGRSMEFASIAELMQVHSFWRAKVMTEQTASAVANGHGNPRNLYTRFRTP